jgi:hypothetical protein
LLFCAALAAADAAQAQIAFRAAAQAGAAAGQAAPVFQAAGAAVSGTGGVAPAWPAHAVNDVGLLFCESTGGQAVTLTAANGFAAVAGSPQATGAGTAGTRLTVFWARATSAGMAAPVVADPGNHVYCRILTYRGVTTTGNPWDVTGGGVKAAASTTVTLTGVTTTIANALIVQAVSRDTDSSAAAFSAQANANLTGIAERSDGGTTAGNGGGIGIWDGVMVLAGATGSTTATVASSVNAFLTIALRPPDSTLTISVPAGTAANDVMIASVTYRPCSNASGAACTTTITPPAGWTQVNTVTDQTTGAGTGGFGNRLFVYQRVATGAEPASYTWTFGGQLVHAGAAGGIVGFSGVDTASPVVAQGGQATASSTSHAAPSIDTGAVTNSVLVSSHTANSSASWTPPPGMTESADAASLAVPDGLGLSIEMNRELFAGPGTTGTRTAAFSAPAPAADTGITHMLALRPAVALTHYAIGYPGGSTAITCDPHQVTITGHDSVHGAVAPPAGTVLSLSTSTGTGVWTVKDAGSGTWTPSGLNNGLATYTWPGGETSFTVRLRHNTAITLGINLLDGAARSEGAGAEDPSLTFADAAFRVTDAAGAAVATFGTHIAGKRSDVGFGAQARYLQAIRTDTATGSCVALIQSQTVTVEMAGARIDPAGGASQISIRDSGGGFVTVATSAGAPPGGYTGVSLAFDAQSKAPLVFSYPDAGSIAIYARYALPAPPAASYVSGNSNTFVVRPFGLRVSGVTTSAAPAPSDPVFAAAGQNFNATVTAVAWKTGDDADSDGVPDNDAQIAANPATPNFGQETTAATATLSHALNAPAGGAAGTLGGSTTFSGFAAGAKTQAVTWSEVGFIDLFASSANYLGSGQNVTNSAAGLTGVGRFRPEHFFVASAGTFGPACASGTAFTYLGQGFGVVSVQMQARALGGTATLNYTGAYARHNPGTLAAWGFGACDNCAVAGVGGTALSARLGTAGTQAAAWSNGAIDATFAGLTVERQSPDARDGPFDAVRIGIAPSEPDGVALRAADLDLDTDRNGAVDRKRVGTNAEGRFRFGMLRLENATGSGTVDLPVTLSALYWNSATSGFLLNADDSCTTLMPKNFVLSGHTGGVSNATLPTPTAGADGAVSVSGFTSGLANLKILKPTTIPAQPGAVDLCLDLDGGAPRDATCAAAVPANKPWLQGLWLSGGTAYDDDPRSRLLFGVYGSEPRNVIFRRENY